MTCTCNCLSWIENRVERHLGVDGFYSRNYNIAINLISLFSTTITFNCWVDVFKEFASVVQIQERLLNSILTIQKNINRWLSCNWWIGYSNIPFFLDFNLDLALTDCLLCVGEHIIFGTNWCFFWPLQTFFSEEAIFRNLR